MRYHDPALFWRCKINRFSLLSRLNYNRKVERLCSSQINEESTRELKEQQNLHSDPIIQEMMRSVFAPENYDPKTMTKAQFWTEHERNRKNHHEFKRNEFITEKYFVLLIYMGIFFLGSAGLFYFRADFSLGDQTALHFKATKRVVRNSPIADNVLGQGFKQFGIYGMRKRNPYYKVRPINETGSQCMLEIRFHAKGDLTHGIIYAEALIEGQSSLKFKKVQLITDDEVWDLRKPTEFKNISSLF